MDGKNHSFKRVTLDDIAKIVNVSRTTVSLALNDKGTLSSKLREEVKKVAKELNYIPNPLAQALRGVRTKSVGVVINYFSNFYFREFYNGLEEASDEQKFSFIVSQSYESIDKEIQQVAKFSEYGVDGLIVLPCSQEKEHLTRVSGLGIPIVLISNSLDNDFAAVVADNIRGTEMAVLNLMALDDRPIFHIAGPQNQSSQCQRCESFLKIMQRERPHVPSKDLVYVVEGLREPEGSACIQKILQKHSPPFSLFVSNDELAVGVIRYVNENALSLPGDVAITCFSGDSTLSFIHPSVSTIAVQAKRMGEITVRLLFDLIERPEDRKFPPTITLPVTLQNRCPLRLP